MLPRKGSLLSLSALFLLACCLALLTNLCINKAVEWLNGDGNLATLPFPSSYGYSSAELKFQRELDGDNNTSTKKYYKDHPRSRPVCPVGLRLGDINILVVTDIHGWIAGQHARHEPYWNVDMGDLVSFYQQLEWQQNPPWYTIPPPDLCNPHGDWFLVFNGDMMDGTGLSTIPPNHMVPLLQQVPFSALNVGNHELYHNEVVDYMMENKGFIHHWKGNYLASNVDYYVNSTGSSSSNKKLLHDQQYNSETGTVPFGNRYTFLHGPVLNSTILTFGFLYNFQNNCNHTRVRQVEDTLKEDWFVNILTKSYYDAIIVMGHMDAVDPLVYKILDAIRALVGPDMPIQFLTGHSHRRHFEQLDPLATSLEAGRFMDTIGFASFPLKSTTDYVLKKPADEEVNIQTASSLFQHEFLDANYKVLGTDVLGMPDQDFSTHRGRKLSIDLKKTQERMGLLEVVTDCAPQDYKLAKPLNDTDSLWWLYMEQVIPTTFFPILQATDVNVNVIPIFIQGTGALRYSLFSPKVVVDDIIAVTPFENPIYQVGSHLTAEELVHVFDGLHVDDDSQQWPMAGLPNFGVAGQRPSKDDDANNKNKRYDLYTVSFHVAQAYAQVQNATKDDKNAMPFKPRPVYEPFANSSTGGRKQLETTKIWMDFVRQQWSCPDEEATTRHLRGKISMPSMMAALSIVMVVMFALGLRRVRKQSKTYESAVLVSEQTPLTATDSPKLDYAGL